MQIKQLEVINPLLKDYIDYYYILTTFDEQDQTEYIAYPSFNTPLCFLERCAVQIREDNAEVSIHEQNSLIAIIVGRSLKPVNISLPKGIREFCIVLKPLAANYLHQKNMGHLLYPGLKETQLFDFLRIK